MLLCCPQPTVWLSSRRLTAKVLAVRADVTPNLVLIAAGSNEGIVAGQTLVITRGNTFVGWVLVERVLADSAGCMVLYTDDDLGVHAGDKASSH